MDNWILELITYQKQVYLDDMVTTIEGIEDKLDTLHSDLDGVEGKLNIDGITNSLRTIDYAHHEIHAGDSFTAGYVLTTAATNSHRTGVYIKTGATKLCHMVVSFSASTSAEFYVCESPTIASNTGTHGVAIYNRYRDNNTASSISDNATSPAVSKITTLTEAQIAGDVTFAQGTILRTEPLTVGSGPKPAGGSSRDSQEYILKANTKYIFMIINLSADANKHHILLDWYEHTNI